MPTNNHDPKHRAPAPDNRASEDPINPGPGYETTDVNVGGVVVFLSGLSGFLVVFFLFCFVMGKVINTAFIKEDGPPNKWTSAMLSDPGGRGNASASPAGGLHKNLANNPEMEQRELQHMTDVFPQPRLDIDDGNQAIADLHAREDLLLEHYSSGKDGTTRIPISHAMELVAQRGLPVVPSASAQATEMAGDGRPAVLQPLTTGFARTAYELDVMEARAQKLSYGEAESGPKQNLQDRR